SRVFGPRPPVRKSRCCEVRHRTFSANLSLAHWAIFCLYTKGIFPRPPTGEDFMRKLVLAISTVALAVSAAYADPIADRKAIMKERGGLAGNLAKMAKGETPFDAAAVLTALQGLKANDEKLDIDALFPAGSDKGDTKASPQIWQDMAGFKADEAKLTAAT